MKPQLHISGLQMLQSCGEQYRRRYIEGERIAPGVAILIGSATDRSVTADLQSKIDTGALLANEQIRDAARDSVVAEWEKGVSLDPEDGTEGQAKGTAIDAAVRLAELHHEGLAPTLAPTQVQRAWTLEVNGLPVDLAGTIDIQEGSATIRDTKTAAKSPTANAAHESLQLTTYALAAHVIDGAIPEKLTLDYLVRTKTPKLVVLETTREVADFDPLLERIMAATRALESGIFIPARPDDWRCSAKFCGYFQSCRFAMRPKTFAI